MFLLTPEILIKWTCLNFIAKGLCLYAIRIITGLLLSSNLLSCKTIMHLFQVEIKRMNIISVFRIITKKGLSKTQTFSE